MEGAALRVAVFNGPDRSISIEQVPEPQPAADEVLVKIHRCGICGSDLSMTQAGPFCFPAGLHLGHEYAGEVVETGTNVTDVNPGDRVAGIPSRGCGQCENCRAGLFLFCSEFRPLFGGFGDYVALPRRNAVLLPKTLSLADGALIEPIASGLHALRWANMQPGDRILILGAGAMAAAVTYWARRLGAAAIAVTSRSAHRR